MFLAFGLFDTGQFWPLFAQVSRPVWFGGTMLQGGTSELSMELMQAKLVRLLSKTLYWFNVFTVQLDYAAASAPRLGVDTRVAQATAGTLRVPGSADPAFVCRLPSDTLFTLSVSSGCLCTVRADFHLVDGELSKPCDFVTVST